MRSILHVYPVNQVKTAHGTCNYALCSGTYTSCRETTYCLHLACLMRHRCMDYSDLFLYQAFDSHILFRDVYMSDMIRMY